jgi:hypothetical protein
MVETKNAHRNFVGKPEGKYKHPGESERKREDNIKMYLKKVGL